MDGPKCGWICAVWSGGNGYVIRLLNVLWCGVVCSCSYSENYSCGGNIGKNYNKDEMEIGLELKE
jgi:hypothetical protein